MIGAVAVAPLMPAPEIDSGLYLEIDGGLYRLWMADRAAQQRQLYEHFRAEWQFNGWPMPTTWPVIRP